MAIFIEILLPVRDDSFGCRFENLEEPPLESHRFALEALVHDENDVDVAPLVGCASRKRAVQQGSRYSAFIPSGRDELVKLVG